jgi:hypothetical protein
MGNGCGGTGRPNLAERGSGGVTNNPQDSLMDPEKWMFQLIRIDRYTFPERFYRN